MAEVDTEEDFRVGYDMAQAVASALEAGWTLEQAIDLLEDMWPDMVKFYAQKIAQDAISDMLMPDPLLAGADVKRP